ncbi:MAG: hypothetical protein ACFE85_10080 [Candidatus Hodarchaeota archaeon]
MENRTILKKDISALEKVLELIILFYNKNQIRKSKLNFEKLKYKIQQLKEIKDESSQSRIKLFTNVLRRLKSIIKRDCISNIYFLIGGHGGIIIQDIPFCEFDFPLYTLKQLVINMKMAKENQIPYHLEITTCCLEYLNDKYSNEFSRFLELAKNGPFEIINPTYSQPYNLIIGSESNIKQFEYGLRVLKKLGLKSNIYYCSEVSLHPQIPQILKNFKINFASLRTRIFGTCPSSYSGLINWVGFDNSKIKTITDQVGIYNGEYWHRAFYQEIPNLLFQAVSRPFVKDIIYSSIEDCVKPLPIQEEIWRISKFSDLFGKFVSISELIDMIDLDGEFKYKRDDFYLGKEIFNQSDLFLNTSKCEANLITAEIINTILSLFNKDSNDDFFEHSWSRFLLTQAHDNYAVPYIKTGDYSAQHLTKEDYNNFEITTESISISELSNGIQKGIQNDCKKFIEKSLIKLSDFLKDKSEDSENEKLDFFIFNPTIYNRSDIVDIPLILENPSHFLLLDEKAELVNFSYENSRIKFISEISSMGYVIYSLVKTDKIKFKPNSYFSYDIIVSKDKKNLVIKFNDLKVYELKFKANQDYNLKKVKEYEDLIEKRIIFEGQLRSTVFNLDIIQYNNINRLEFQIKALNLEELILIPAFQIEKTYINYPFGIEETKRSRVQSLDFIWLKGVKRNIVYFQKNCQLFNIDRKTSEISNIFKRNGIYEISITVLDEIDFYSVYRENILYKFRLYGICTQGHYNYQKKSDSFLSLKFPIILTNLWRRAGKNYLRILNPDYKKNIVILEGSLMKLPIKLIDFNYNILEKLDNKEYPIEPWRIQTFTF